MIAVWLVIGGLAQAADSSLLLTAVRFYRADPGRSPGVTQVTAMLRVPAGLPAAGAGGEVTLDFRARVVGDTGVLYEQKWRRRTALPYPRGDADRLEVLRFSVASGQYRLEASVVDSVSGRRAAAVVPIDGYPEPPTVSDLLLSSWVRPVAAADTIPQPGEFRRGNLVIAIAPEVAVGGAAASVAYLVETYAGSPVDATLTVAITDEQGAVRRRTEPTPVRLAAGIGLLSGRVDVGRLPRGEFSLEAQLGLGDRTVRRASRFVVDPAAGTAPAALSDAAYFGRMSTAELERAFAPLPIIGPPGSLQGWPADGPDGEKRKFLAGFWSERDPTPMTGNERRARFYDGVRYTDAFYADADLGLDGWQTDRGRVFLREGLPTQVLKRPQRPTVPRFEVWRYFDRPSRFYVFADQGAGQGVVLIRSNDPNEDDAPDWQAVLTPTGVRETVGFVGREVLEPTTN